MGRAQRNPSIVFAARMMGFAALYPSYACHVVPGRTNCAARTQSLSVLHDCHVGHRGGSLVVVAAVSAAIGQDAVILDLEVGAGG
jgi:hypothetical protein